MQTKQKEQWHKHFLKILVTRINLANTVNKNLYVCSIRFNIKEFETYVFAMQDQNVAK